MLGAIFKILLLGFVGIVAVGAIMAVLGIAMTLAMVALKVGVVVAIGYGAVKLFQSVTHRHKAPEISAEDRKWLES